MDAERRAAERAVRADPHDPASARALAEALRRAGDRRALFHALCALARAGDAEAAAEVEAWHPWPGPDGRGNRRAGIGRPVRDPVATRVARLPVGVPRAIAGASATHLFVVCAPPGWDPNAPIATPGEALVAVDLSTLEVAWRVESPVGRFQWGRPVVLVGEQVAWGTGDAVRVFAARDGTESYVLPLERAPTQEEPVDGHLLQADGNRLAIQAQSTRIRVHELTWGARLWEDVGLRMSRAVAAFDGALLLADGRSLELSCGELTERSRWIDLTVAHVSRLGRGDHVAHVAAHHRSLVRVDPSGSLRWAVPLAGASARQQLVVLGEQVVGDVVVDGSDWSAAFSLDTGKQLWVFARRPADEGALPARSSVGAGGDLVLLDAGPRTSIVRAFSPTAEMTLDLTLELPLLVRPPWRDIARVDFAELVALDGALLVVATGDEGDLVLARVDGPAVASIDGPAVASVDGPAVASVDGPAVASVDGPAVASGEGA